MMTTRVGAAATALSVRREPSRSSLDRAIARVDSAIAARARDLASFGLALGARAVDDSDLEQLGDVIRAHAGSLVGLQGRDAVLEHLDAEGACHRHHLRAGVDR